MRREKERQKEENRKGKAVGRKLRERGRGEMRVERG